MKFRNLIFILSFIFLTNNLFSQIQNIEFEDSKFPERIKELRQAQKNIQKGDKTITEFSRKLQLKGIGRYEEALTYYLEANDFNPNNSLLNYKIGTCYMNTVEKYKAVPYFEKAYILNKNVRSDLAYQLGQAYQYNYEFDKAIQKFTEFEKNIDNFERDILGTRVEKKINECRIARDMVKNPLNVKISNLGPQINTKFPEYSPIVNADQTIMFFTGRKPNTTGDKISFIDGKFYEDIYITYFKDVWAGLRNPGKPLNSKTHDAIVGVSLDGKTLLTYKAYPRDNGDIYISRLKDDKYTKPKRLNKNINTVYHETSATFSPDGTKLYFVSDREGGYGGRDIWVSSKDAKDEWAMPVNLGPAVNTSYNEEGVFMQGDGKTLYFSSQGHNSMGGYDIFRTVLEDGKWSQPVSIGYPINTPYDDVFLSLTRDGRHGYYASGKKGGYGDQDIYEIEFFEIKVKNIIVRGTVFDGETKKPLPARVNFIDKSINVSTNTVNTPAETGEFSAALPNNKTFLLDASSPGYSNYQENLPVGRDLDRTIYLYPDKTIPSKGFVYDADTKQPVCNALINVRDYENKFIVDTIKTLCPSGEFMADAPIGKTYEILVNADNYSPYYEIVLPDKNVNHPIFIKKISLTDLKGYVLDAESKLPVCNAVVDIKESADNKQADNLNSNCVDGNYKSELPLGKTYILTVSADNYETHSEVIPPQKSVNKTIFLYKALPNTGIVYDAETQNPVCADLVIRTANNNQIAEQLKTDCPSGQYKSPLPADKNYIINATAPGYQPYTENIPVGQNVNKVILINKIYEPVGNVYDEDTKEPVCANVVLENPLNNTQVESIKTNCPSGEFKLKSPKGQNYRLKVTAPEYNEYIANIPTDEEPNRPVYIKKIQAITYGYVLDADTREPLCAEIQIIDFKTKAIAEKLSNDCATGRYAAKATNNRAYELSVTAKDYVPLVEVIEIGDPVNKTVYLKKIEKAITEGKLYDITKAKSFVLPQILYDYDKYDLKPQYQDSLKNLISTMRAFPNIVIELGSHTDTRGSDAYNEKLSYNRAKSVVDYLISKGIESDRLVAKGYGEKVSRVLDKKAKIVSCNKSYTFEKGTVFTDAYINALPEGKCQSEAAHQLNRRTEFKVIREDYVPDVNRIKKDVDIKVVGTNE